VVDASVAVAVLIAPNAEIETLVPMLGESHLAAPGYLPVEVDSALRGLERGGRLSAAQALVARERFAELTIDLWPWEPLADRAWELRANLPTYDAGYAALAERIDAVLVTADARLAGAPGLRCAVDLLA
jgi:predicted nucleic acid-binding protein